MKKIFCIGRIFMIYCLFLLSFFNADCQKIGKADSIEIAAIMSKQETDWSNGNTEAYMQGYWKSDSLRFITKKGILYGWQDMLDRYKKSYPDKSAMGLLKFDVISMEKLSDDKAMVCGKWTLSRSTDELSGYFTLIWKKIKGKWLIVVDHTS